MKLIAISGLSGSGKSVALKTLEDLGFNAIDNLPLVYITDICQHLNEKPEQSDLAVSIDIRNTTEDIKNFYYLLEKARKAGKNWEVIYLDANDEVILRRYSETRRKHPLSNENTTLQEAIALERKYLEPIANAADLIINTSTVSKHELETMLKNRVGTCSTNSLSVLVQSFGFKHGTPSDSDFIFDVRCLPNPYWVPELRDLNGLNPKTVDYLKKQPLTNELYQQIHSFLQEWIPKFKATNRSYLTVSLGCTGGFHRSVCMAEWLGNTIKLPQTNILVRHKELDANDSRDMHR